VADASGSPHSGSLRFAAPSGFSSAVNQCVPITAGVSYALSVSARLDAAVELDDNAYVQLGFFSDTQCSAAALLRYAPGASTNMRGGWVTLGTVDTAPASAKSALVVLGIYNDGAAGGPQVTANFDDVQLAPGTCAPGLRSACLAGGRFRVEASWTAPGRPGGPATAVPDGANSVAFWFFDPNAADLVVKVVDGCAVNHQFWIFAGGLTNAGVTLTVTDTWTGKPKKYTSLAGKLFAPIVDVKAFATCP